MRYITVLVISAALGVDAFSVAIGVGLSGIKRKDMYLVAGVVTLFHIFMPLLGLSLGAYLGRIAGPVAGRIGAFVLIAIGLSMVWEGINDMKVPSWDCSKRGKRLIKVTSPGSLFLMGACVSMDALTVGFGLGTLRVDLALTVITMGVVAGLMTGAGLLFGKRLKRTFRERAQLLGGLILVLIGAKLLFG